MENDKCLTIYESMNFIAENIKKISINLPENTPILIDDIEKSIKNRIFLIGGGRSGFEARAFAMRLMHLGFNSRVIYDYTTPVPDLNDLVIVISRSGNTKSVINKVKNINRSKIITITTNNNSELGNMSNMVVILPIDDNKNHKISPMGTLFEVVMHVFLDAIIAELIIRSKISEDEMRFRHLFSEYVGIV